MTGDRAHPAHDVDSHPGAVESERLQRLIERAADQLRDGDEDELRAIVAAYDHDALGAELAVLEHHVDERAALEARFHRARSQAHGLIQHADRCQPPRLALTPARRAQRRSVLARREELLTRAHEHEANAEALRDAFDGLPTPGHLSRWCTNNGPRLARGLVAQGFLRAKVKAVWHLLGAPSLAPITARHLHGTTIDLGAVLAAAEHPAQRTLAALALQVWREDGEVTLAEIVALHGEDLDRALRAVAISRRREHTAGRGDSDWIDAELAINATPQS